MYALLIVWPFICGIANRIRGGWLMNIIKRFYPGWATTPARIFVSFIISVPVFLNHSLLQSSLFWFLLYIGFIFRWSPWNIMLDPKRDIACLTLRGLVLTLPAGYALGLWIFGLSGSLMGLIYYFAYKVNIHHKDCDGYEWVSSDWGELFLGALLGFSICISCI